MSSDNQDASSIPGAGRAWHAIEILLQAFTDLTTAGQVVVPTDNQQEFKAVLGWRAWISRSSHLVLLAHDAGFGHESSPSVRSIIEHTLVMQWVVDVGDEALAALGSAMTNVASSCLMSSKRSAGLSRAASPSPRSRDTSLPQSSGSSMHSARHTASGSNTSPTGSSLPTSTPRQRARRPMWTTEIHWPTTLSTSSAPCPELRVCCAGQRHPCRLIGGRHEPGTVESAVGPAVATPHIGQSSLATSIVDCGQRN
jgi:hypothetical protein